MNNSPLKKKNESTSGDIGLPPVSHNKVQSIANSVKNTIKNTLSNHSRTSSNISESKKSEKEVPATSSASGPEKRKEKTEVKCTIKEPGVRLLLSIGRKGRGDGCLSRKA